MKRTINIHLGGMPFIIDEEAFDKLNNYIQTLKNKFTNEQERSEIMADIEYRMAEVFAKRLDKNRQVVDLEDVDYIIAQLGKPEEIFSEESAASGEHQAQTEQTTYTDTVPNNATKKLFRDSDNKIIGGVIAGLCHYFGIKETLWIRLAFMALLWFSFGTFLLVYLVFWLVIPEAKTYADKLQMKGEPVNLDTIEKEVRETLSRATDAINKPLRDNDLLAKFGTVIMMIAKGFLKFIALIVFVISLFILFGILVSAAGFSVLGLPKFAVFTQLIFNSHTHYIVSAIALFVVIGVPLFFLMYLCATFIASSKVVFHKRIAIGSAALWMIALAVVFYFSVSIANGFKSDDIQTESIAMVQPVGDTIFVNSFQSQPGNSEGEIAERYEDVSDFLGDVMITENGYSFDNSTLKLAVSPDTEFHLEQTLEAAGRNKSDARKQISLINSRFAQNGSTLLLSERVEVFKNAKFREQDVTYTLYIPEGKVVKINGSFNIDIVNFERPFDEENISEKAFTVIGGKLTCVNCTNFEQDEEESDSEDEIVNIINKDSVVIRAGDKNERVNIRIGKKEIKIETKQKNP
jgi:phage shock protein PspC (stress-responsive transcriptional regulator)